MRREKFDAEQAGAGLVRRIRLGNLSSCGSNAVLIVGRAVVQMAARRTACRKRLALSVHSSGEGGRRDTSDGHALC